MSDLSSSPTSPWDQVDLGALEARLNSLGTSAEIDPDAAVGADCPTLLEQFMSDPTLKFLGSRTMETDEENFAQETIVQCHRISVEPYQTRVILHLSFTPDLPTVPSVEINLIDSDGRTRVTQNSKFGTRVEISLLNGNPAPANICVEAVCTTVPTCPTQLGQ